MQPQTAAQLVLEAKQRVENLSAERVAAELDRGDAILEERRPITKPAPNVQH